MCEHYKVVELSTVDDASIEEALNTWTAEGLSFDGMHFAMREGSRRPAMAFLIFSRAPAGPAGPGPGPGPGRAPDAEA